MRSGKCHSNTWFRSSAARRRRKKTGAGPASRTSRKARTATLDGKTIRINEEGNGETQALALAVDPPNVGDDVITEMEPQPEYQREDEWSTNHWRPHPHEHFTVTAATSNFRDDDDSSNTTRHLTFPTCNIRSMLAIEGQLGIYQVAVKLLLLRLR